MLKVLEVNCLNEQNTLKNIRIKNLSDILQVLRSEGSCSLAQLTEQISGGLTTVKKCVLQAIELGMVCEGDTADSTGGRKAKLYFLNKEYQYFVFLVVDDNSLICRICNFGFHVIEEYTVGLELEDLLASVYNIMDKASAEYNVGTVCLALPCVLNDGVVMDWFYNPAAVGLDVKKKLKEKYGVNVIVQNDMKLTAIGECAEYRGDIVNIATVQFGHNGVGVGATVNGNVLTGSTGFAGEVGYIDDLRKNIMGISFPAKIVKNIIIFLNPQLIVFYRSQRQNQFEKIFKAAVRDLPSFALPEFKVSDDYFNSINNGFISLINKYGYFKKPGVKK